MPIEASPRRVQRVRHEIQRRELTVRQVQDIGPHLRRVVLAGESLHDFVSASFDDHVKVFFPAADGSGPAARDYTPRHFDRQARELTLEFVLHGEGPASSWAAQAAPGQTLVVAGPRGSFVIPVDYAWHLLAGDATALPAVARRLEELPAGARALVLLEVADAADRPRLSSRAAVDLQWVEHASALEAAVHALALPAGEGYAWCAGEASVVAGLRRILVEEKGHDRHAIRAAAYWKRGAVAHHENLEG